MSPGVYSPGEKNATAFYPANTDGDRDTTLIVKPPLGHIYILQPSSKRVCDRGRSRSPQ